jgi:hypothetical protein
MRKSTKEGDRLNLRNGAIAVVIVFVVEAIVFFAGDYRRGGFQPCDRLDERICRDLGHERCHIWEADLHRVESGSVSPAPYRSTSAVFDRIREVVLGWHPTRSDNLRCYRQLKNGYPGLLKTINVEIDRHLASQSPPPSEDARRAP